MDFDLHAAIKGNQIAAEATKNALELPENMVISPPSLHAYQKKT